MKRREAGFTLVEVLIAVALLGMLTVLAYGTVKFGAVSWRRVSEYREAEADRSAIVRVLRQSIARAYPAFLTRDTSDRRIAFDGTPDGIALIAPLPAAIEVGVMARERFYTASEGSSRALYMGWALDLPAATGGQLKPRVARLARDIGAFRLAYFGAHDANHPAVWQDRWSGVTSLPDLVRVLVWRKDTRGTPWIDLTVHPATTTTADCVYDPIDANCRRLE